ncbi:MAG: peroxiredoxin [Cyclobacteriaceae bacterium]|nr:peroxiredoxin [Cyclobacteriaceae bacterium]
MSKIKKGDMIPFFILKDHDNNEFNIRNLIGSPMVIYFYPKDDTPGCTREACSFRDNYEDFISAGAAVIGISEDPPESHRKFRERYRLPFTLLSDTDNKVRKLFGVPATLFGLIPGRVTYIVDSHGKLRHIFNSQHRTAQHVKEALRIIYKME